MNHRDLILSAEKKARFAFLGLPEDVQDEIIDGLDGQTLTIQDASALLKQRGHTLSYVAISGYYRAVRLERRLQDSRQELSRIISEYAGKPQKEALEGLANLTIALAATGLVDGSVGIAKINLPKLVEAMGQTGEKKPEEGKPAEQPAGDGVPDAETIRKIRERFL